MGARWAGTGGERGGPWSTISTWSCRCPERRYLAAGDETAGGPGGRVRTGGLGADAWLHDPNALPLEGVESAGLPAPGGTPGGLIIKVAAAPTGGSFFRASMITCSSPSGGIRSLPLVLMLCALAAPASPQAAAKYDTSLYRGLVWRQVGPFRGGRVTAVAGVGTQPLVFYMGGTGGGVWKTVDAGLTWEPVSDKYFTAGSVGAIAVAPSDPNVVYAGTGESPIRGNVSPGDGMYKSTDAGRTWSKIGLADAGQIAHIAVHPQNSDLVY